MATSALYSAAGSLSLAANPNPHLHPSSSSLSSPSSSSLPKPSPSHHAPFESLVRDKPSQRAVNELCLQLRRGQLHGAENVAIATAKVLRSVASAAKFQTLQQLVDILKAVGRLLQAAQPREQTIGNITRRVVHLLREEARIAINEAQEGASAASSGRDSSPAPHHLSSSLANLTLSPTAQSPQPLPTQPVSRVWSSPLASPGTVVPPAGNTLSSRPGPSPLRSDSAFLHGSFSISDLVMAGAMATPALPTPGADSPDASTPYGPLSRTGSGFFNQPNVHVQGGSQISQFSVTEDPDGEAKAEAQDEEGERSFGESFDSDDDEVGEGEEVEDEDEDDDEEDDNVETASLRRPAAESKAGTAAAMTTTTTTKKADVGAYWLKPLVVQAIQEMLFELEEADENIAKDARDHIHSGEVILTLGYSKTTEEFFKAAAKERKFTVIVAETAPSYTGHRLARNLSRSSISTLLIPDSCIFAVMPRVSKVVLGSHAILANGGLLTSPGSYPIALAAASHATPIVVLAATYKICPEWHSLDDFISPLGSSAGNEGSPHQVIDFATHPNLVEQAEVVNPQWDYVKPEWVDVFITNSGEHPPSYVYRLVKESYDASDLVL
ncbi:GCD complex subunit gcd7 [Thecaphora frezii]